ncbi:hypothetical protein [Xanthobacter aminoxidans]|uniref:hypothetical protein n=1 Tax=Xanthobacter aminoxidans TaxID=186280 RepID=UPI002022D218|nr:hypothetical protein [Xanthobacter aminoxidans]MCL8382074.1 hypothetical protein [Xanthobacter aminoxidans]
MSKMHPAIELAAVLSREAAQVAALRHPSDLRDMPEPHQIAADAAALLHVGARVKRWAERACNGEGHMVPDRQFPLGSSGKAPYGRMTWTWDETDDAAKDKADARHLKQATEIAARYGASVTIGGDPRGYVLRLVLASGRTNTLGNDGWGVA